MREIELTKLKLDIKVFADLLLGFSSMPSVNYVLVLGEVVFTAVYLSFCLIFSSITARAFSLQG